MTCWLEIVSVSGDIGQEGTAIAAGAVEREANKAKRLATRRVLCCNTRAMIMISGLCDYSSNATELETPPNETRPCPILMNDVALRAIIKVVKGADSFRADCNYTISKGFPRVTGVTLW